MIFARRSNQSATQLRGVQIHSNVFRGGNQNPAAKPNPGANQDTHSISHAQVK